MATPNIPHLNTFRSSRTKNARNSTRGSPSSEEEQGEEQAAKDKIIQQTDQDASMSRLSAVEVGYLDDRFAGEFVEEEPVGKGIGMELGKRRFPIINRGTYVRTTAIDKLISLFLSQHPSQKKQIVSFGAGSDTRFFRLMASSSPTTTNTDLHPPLIYHELDFPANTATKIATITRSPLLTAHIPTPVTISPTADALHSPAYHIHPCDLRLLPSSPSPNSLLPYIDPSLPTLLISECCLCYLPPSAADAVATFFTQCLFPPSTPLALILYEPINPSDDAFGKVMVANLATRGIELQTLRKYATLGAQRARLASYGFRGGGVSAQDVNELWKSLISEDEKLRVAGLEMVDEVEEWELLAAHYCVAWGWREGGKGGKGRGEDDGKGGGEGGKAGEEDSEGELRFWEGWKGVMR